jgi:acyl-CoA thioesterase I
MERRTYRPWRGLCIAVLACTGICAAQSAVSPTSSPCTPLASDESLAVSVLHPFWQNAHMDRETALFEVEPNATEPTARLLFTPTRILQVTSANGDAVYEEGRDYRWNVETNLLSLPPDSRIPFRTWEQMHPPIGAPQTLAEAVGGKTSVFFERFGAAFQAFQVAVSYEHEQQWEGYTPASATEALATTMQLLRAKKPVKLVVLGDSISFGSGSSSDYRLTPCQPPYVSLVADGLRAEFGGQVELINLSVGGKTAAWGAAMAPQVAAEMPDLVVIAFGMNDASADVPVANFIRDIKKTVDIIRASSPKVNIILLATMSGNPEWSKSSPQLYREYRDALAQLKGPGIAVADMTALSEDMLKAKKFDDLTANGVNHPNDFGHRVYAQLVLQLFR